MHANILQYGPKSAGASYFLELTEVDNWSEEDAPIYDRSPNPDDDDMPALVDTNEVQHNDSPPLLDEVDEVGSSGGKTPVPRLAETWNVDYAPPQ